MARGITELEVHQAADSLVVAGERPTVERVRAALGTGSPNTVIRHLDAWWTALGPRLVTQTAVSALPEMPDAVAALAQRLWRDALEAAAGHATEQVAVERQALQDERVALGAERSALQSRVAELQHAADGARQDLKASQDAQLDLRAQLDRAGNLAKDLQLHRDAATSRADRLESQLAVAQQLLGANRETYERERAELTEYVRAVESRGHREVDRLRQQLAAAERDRDAVATRSSKAALTYEEALRGAREDIASAREEAKLQKAFADAARNQLAALQALPIEVAELRNLISANQPRGSRRSSVPCGHKDTATKRKSKTARPSRTE